MASSQYASSLRPPRGHVNRPAATGASLRPTNVARLGSTTYDRQWPAVGMRWSERKGEQAALGEQAHRSTARHGAAANIRAAWRNAIGPTQLTSQLPATGTSRLCAMTKARRGTTRMY